MPMRPVDWGSQGVYYGGVATAQPDGISDGGSALPCRAS
jgi:hypothetical protein